MSDRSTFKKEVRMDIFYYIGKDDAKTVGYFLQNGHGTTKDFDDEIKQSAISLAVCRNRPAMVRVMLQYMGPVENACYLLGLSACLDDYAHLCAISYPAPAPSPNPANGGTYKTYNVDVSEVFGLLFEHFKKRSECAFVPVPPGKLACTGRTGIMRALLLDENLPTFRSYVCADTVFYLLGHIHKRIEFCYARDFETFAQNMLEMLRVILEHGANMTGFGLANTPLMRLAETQRHQPVCRYQGRYRHDHPRIVEFLDDIGCLLLAHGESPFVKRSDCPLRDAFTVFCVGGARDAPDEVHLGLGCKHGPLPVWLRGPMAWRPDTHRHWPTPARSAIHTAMVLRHHDVGPLALLPIELMFVVFEMVV